MAFRKKIYETIEQLQIDLDLWIDYYNNERTHQGKVCEGRTPMQTLLDGKAIWKEKFVDQTWPGRYRLKSGNCQIGSELLHVSCQATSPMTTNAPTSPLMITGRRKSGFPMVDAGAVSEPSSNTR